MQLPLFPLPLVVFPRTRLPLHIFEDRYREMVGLAIAEKSEFGVVLANSDGLVNTGCTVLVSEVTQRYPDGRFDIMTEGFRRFRILELDSEKSYLRGAIEFFDDEREEEIPSEDKERALAGYRQWLLLNEASSWASVRMDDPQLSFQLAQGLADNDFRQTLLHNRSELDRLRQVSKYFADYVPRQRLAIRMKELSATNGHGAKPAGLT